MKKKCENEIWRAVIGFEGRYMVSNLGRIKSIKYGKEFILKPEKMKLGYIRCHFGANGESKKYLLHVLVANAFGISEKGKEINHIDGNKGNNRADNLEACTRSENITHAFRTGLIKPMLGEKNGNSKYNHRQVLGILAARELGMGRSDICKVLGLPLNFVKDVIGRRAWKHVSLEKIGSVK